MAEAKKTQWLGLWKNRQGVYSGQVFKKADIPPYSRLIVRYNKFRDANSNRPAFVYCFASGDAADAITIEVTKSEYASLAEYEDMYCFTHPELQRLINLVAVAAGGDGEWGEHIVSDFCHGYGMDTHVY